MSITATICNDILFLSRLLRVGLISLALWGQAKAQTVNGNISSKPMTMSIVYLDSEPNLSARLSRLDPPPEDEGLAGAKLAIIYNNTTGRFLNQNFELKPLRLASDYTEEEWTNTISQLPITESGILVVNLPAKKLLDLSQRLEGKDWLLLNAGATDNDLRQQNCRANILHTAASDAMRSDSLAELALLRRWSKLLIVKGEGERNQDFAKSMEESAAKFKLKLVSTQTWQLNQDIRRSIGTEILSFTQKLPDHDFLLIADEDDDFARYFPYNHWFGKPIGGDGGLHAELWSPVIESDGATQLQDSFQKLFHRPMRRADYAVWLAIRAVGEAMSKQPKPLASSIKNYMLSSDFALAGYKGRKLSFRLWDGQLRQPMVIYSAEAMLAMAPFEEFMHENNELDSLGYDSKSSLCKKFR